MADYIYLLEHRLSVAQRAAVHAVRTLALEKGLTVFLVGGAVRDLTSGSPVRDLDFLLQGDALTLRKEMERIGARITGEYGPLKTLYLTMAGGVRAELGSTLSATWPKPGKPVYQPGTLGEDLRRRDFTANAMALSLNDGSYGLLIDPLNGVADIENRELRLVSNYGFIEEPVRMIRAARLMARLGWTLEEKTQSRYETGKEEGSISALNDFQKGYELEEVVHEEDPLRVLKRLETEGWMKVLAPYWTSARINAAELDKLRDAQVQLQMQGVAADGGAAGFPLLMTKLTAQEIGTLKAGFPRQGFVAEIDGLEEEAKSFAALLTSKGVSSPSASWKLIMQTRPEAVLQAAYGSRSPAVQAKFKAFYGDWPQARQRIPYPLLQEMRIVPELEGYAELVETLYFELMDGRLSTPEEMRAFLEPYSPPAPPPPVNLKRARAAKKESKPAKGRSKKVKTEEEILEDPALAEEAEEALPVLSDDEDDLLDAAADEVDANDTEEAADEDDVAEEEEPSVSLVPVAAKKAGKGQKHVTEVAEPERGVVAPRGKAKSAQAVEAEPEIPKPAIKKAGTKAAPAKQTLSPAEVKDTAAKVEGARSKPVPKKASRAAILVETAAAPEVKRASVKAVKKVAVSPVKKAGASSKQAVAAAKAVVPAKKTAAKAPAAKTPGKSAASKGRSTGRK